MAGRCKASAGLKLLTRSATNTYFPQIATVISLPHAEDELTRRVAEFMTDLRDAKNPDEISLARRFNASLRAAFDGFTDEEVFARVEQILSGLGGSDAADPRVAEFEVFASGRSLIGENRPNAHLHAETLPRAVWDPDGNGFPFAARRFLADQRMQRSLYPAQSELYLPGIRTSGTNSYSGKLPASRHSSQDLTP